MKKLLAALVVAVLAFVACQKEYSLENNSDFGSIGAWEFKDSANKLYAGNPVEYYIDDTSDPTKPHMVYTGTTQSLNQTLTIEIYFPTSVAAPGIYTSAAGQVNFNYSLGAGRSYQADGLAGQLLNENISVNITQISDTTVTGTFSGTALDSASRLVQIKEGKFTYKKRTVVTNPTVSTGSLGSSQDTCTGAILTGTYKKGTAVTSANTVTVTANVTAPGTYTVYTDTLKGIYFYGAGTFSTAGVQTVTLPAFGTPSDTGTVTFRVRYGNSFCTFKVKIDSAANVVVIPPTGDYFPTDAGKNWYYDDYDETGFFDTGYTRSTAQTSVVGGNTYTLFIQDENGALDSSYYRKNAGLYYTLEDLSQFGITTPFVGTFLKDNVTVNTSWTDSVASGGVTVLKAVSTIIAKAVTATVTSRSGTLSSTDVIKVRTIITSALQPGVTATTETWYGRGVGIMYVKETSSIAPTQFVESRLSRYN